MITGYKDKSEYTDKNGIRSVVYLMDNMEAMAQMKPKQYDLAIVDPPYGIGFDGNTTVKGRGGKANTFSDKQHHDKKGWDSNRPCEQYFINLQQLTKNQIIWGGNYFADLLPAKKGWIFWDKKITNANNTNFSDGELAWSSFDCILRRFTYDWIGFGYLNNPQGEKKSHPTQKPVKLYEWLLANYAKQGDTILDTHLGSGSSRIACYNRGFDFTGFEIDPDYFRDSEKRFRNHIKQQKLF